MGQTTAIEWTDATWPVVKGCDYVSPGCANCYAADLIHRHASNPNPKISLPLAGLTNERGRWTGKVYLNEPHLRDPLKWRTPKRIFVPSHGDLFHEDVPDQFIDRVFAVTALAPRHTFQVLTKRPERMRAYLTAGPGLTRFAAIRAAMYGLGRPIPEPFAHPTDATRPWPLPNVWLGVSVEDQQRADERIPHLLATPAAVRFLSCEPLLGPVDLWPFFSVADRHGELSSPRTDPDGSPAIKWVIVGGESGADARPFALDWAEQLRDQCYEAGVAFFMKQVGESPRRLTGAGVAEVLTTRDKKGGDPAEWPEPLRVREFPR